MRPLETSRHRRNFEMEKATEKQECCQRCAGVPQTDRQVALSEAADAYQTKHNGKQIGRATDQRKERRREEESGGSDELREEGEPADADTAAEFSPLGTKETRLRSVSRLNAIRTTPITSRLMCEWGGAARRASPRLAEVVTAMIAMLAQGIGHFKRESAEARD